MSDLLAAAKPSRTTVPHAAYFPHLARPRKGFVFVLGCGQTGDLLLQHLLNLQKNILVHGENEALLAQLVGLWQAEAACALNSLLAGSGPAQDAVAVSLFEGLDRMGRNLAEAFAAGILAVPEEIDYCGFREIRFLRPQVPLEQQIAFMCAFFPGAKFIVALRDPEKTAKSGWWAKGDLQDTVDQLRTAQAQLADVVPRVAGSAAVVVHYEAYMQDPGQLRPVFDLLGLAFDQTAVAAFLKQHGNAQSEVSA